jgi:cyclase
LTNRLSTCGMFGIVVLTVVGAVVCSAQYLPSNKVRPDDGLSSQLVKTGLYVFTGKGSNSVLRLSGNGLILVDGKLPGSYEALVARAEVISRQPIRALILTDLSEASAGNAATFLQNGTAIILQSNLAQNVISKNFQGTAPKGMVTFDHDYQIRMGGIEAQLMHFGNAYSNSDTVVYFPNLKVIAVGRLYGSTVDPDFAAGGSLVGWSSVLAQVLKLDFDTVVPGTGPVGTRADLEAFKNRIDTLVARASELVKKGVPKEQLMSQLKTDDLGWHLDLTPDQLDHFYAELLRTEQSRNGT